MTENEAVFHRALSETQTVIKEWEESEVFSFMLEHVQGVEKSLIRSEIDLHREIRTKLPDNSEGNCFTCWKEDDKKVGI